MCNVTGKKSRKKISKSWEVDKNETQQSVTTRTNLKIILGRKFITLSDYIKKSERGKRNGLMMELKTRTNQI